MPDDPMPQDEEGWRKALTPEQYRVLREGGTEAPFTGEHVHSEADGTFTCTACGNPLFSSDAKFDSGTGWPSFDQAIPACFRKNPVIPAKIRRRTYHPIHRQCKSE